MLLRLNDFSNRDPSAFKIPCLRLMSSALKGVEILVIDWQVR